MSEPRRGAVSLACVHAEIRLEGGRGPYEAPGELSRASCRGMAAMMNNALALLASRDGSKHPVPVVETFTERPAAGVYALRFELLDGRHPVKRALWPVKESLRQTYASWLRWATELMAVTFEVVPPVVHAKTLRVSATPDEDGYTTVVLDERVAYRLPAFLVDLLDVLPHHTAATYDLLSFLRDPNITRIIVIREPLEPIHRHETVLTLNAEFHRRIKDATYQSLAAKTVLDSAPLRDVVTRYPRRERLHPGLPGVESVRILHVPEAEQLPDSHGSADRAPRDQDDTGAGERP